MGGRFTFEQADLEIQAPSESFSKVFLLLAESYCRAAAGQSCDGVTLRFRSIVMAAGRSFSSPAISTCISTQSLPSGVQSSSPSPSYLDGLSSPRSANILDPAGFSGRRPHVPFARREQQPSTHPPLNVNSQSLLAYFLPMTERLVVALFSAKATEKKGGDAWTELMPIQRGGQAVLLSVLPHCRDRKLE